MEWKVVQVCVYVYVWVVGRVRGAAKSRGAGRPSGKQAGRQAEHRQDARRRRSGPLPVGRSNQPTERAWERGCSCTSLHFTSLQLTPLATAHFPPWLASFTSWTTLKFRFIFFDVMLQKNPESTRTLLLPDKKKFTIFKFFPICPAFPLTETNSFYLYT